MVGSRGGRRLPRFGTQRTLMRYQRSALPPPLAAIAESGKISVSLSSFSSPSSDVDAPASSAGDCGGPLPDALMHLIRADEPLGPLLWLGIGGPARYLAEPLSIEDLSSLLVAASGQSIPVRVLGEGSNILVREAGFDGLVISLAAPAFNHCSVDGQRVTVGAGATLGHAVMAAVGAGLAGIEHLVGIPGTVGGAVLGNVSAEGRDLGSVVAEIQLVGADGQSQTIPGSEAGFGHRTSTLGGSIVTAVTLELRPADTADLSRRMQKLWIRRRQQRPGETKRIAMPFINPDMMSVNELVSAAGMAGVREGNVSLHSGSPEHLIAHEGATSDQCVKLLGRVRDQVAMQSGIDLRLNLQIW